MTGFLLILTKGSTFMVDEIWYQNKLHVYSVNEDQFQEFFEKVKNPDNDTELSFNKLKPCPYKLTDKELINKDGAKQTVQTAGDEWCSWTRHHWGPVFDVKAKIEDSGNGYAIYSFESGDYPPIDWIRNIATDYPDLHFILKYELENYFTIGVFKAHGDDNCNNNIEYSDSRY